MEKNTQESKIPWMEDYNPSQSTSIPDIIAENTGIGTVVIFVISALLIITLLFAGAVFIDWRHQKMIQSQQPKPNRKLYKLRLPIMARPLREDRETFADQMEHPEPSTSHEIV